MLSTRISPQQALAIMREPGSVVFDVRSKPLYDEGHIKGAISYPALVVDEATAETMIPTKDTPVLVYCQVGVVAERVRRWLEGFGYERVYSLGGINDWPYELVSE